MIISFLICFCFMSSYQFSIYVRSTVVKSNEIKSTSREEIEKKNSNSAFDETKCDINIMACQVGRRRDYSVGHIPMLSKRRSRFDTDKRFLVSCHRSWWDFFEWFSSYLSEVNGSEWKRKSKHDFCEVKEKMNERGRSTLKNIAGKHGSLNLRGH